MKSIKELFGKEKKEGLDLARQVFKNSKDGTYTDEGYKTFCNFTTMIETSNLYKMYGLFKNDILIGIISTTEDKSGIKLFFIEKEYQGKGFAKLLMNVILENNENSCITVNSSRYAVPIYKTFGFEAVDIEQKKEGLYFTPMKLILKK
ncbi:GNAT family N-acetyltransferase [Fusobacterium russii]|uniref:GNAT family N-acetyltransferase n=1 Tax=Fusobacterium russii TaxID=854 RepID=UPI0003A9067A|nr:GNAT family N-acetyltransferase [Fusobacterium russii]